MNNTQRRVLGYGSAGGLAAVLCWAGFVYQADPDIQTMLGSIDIQLQLAAAIPAQEQSGSEPKARAELRAAVRSYLDRIDAKEPGLALALEYRAFLGYLEGDYANAAHLYRQMRARPDCAVDMRGQAVLNEARMLRLCGRATVAATLLRESLSTLTPAQAATAQQELQQIGGAGNAAEPGPAPATPR